MAHAQVTAPGAVGAGADSTSVWRYFLEVIYRLIGGDPQEIAFASPSEAVAIVSDFYAQHGIPQNLTPEEHLQLENAVLALIAMEGSTLLELGPETATELNKLATDIWMDLNR